MFLGYGQPVTEERLRYYGNLTRFVPIAFFKQACRSAAMDTAGSFPPGPGDILTSALALAPGEYTPGQGRALPRWYVDGRRRVLAGERPKEIGPRSGMRRVDVITDERLS